MKKLVMLVLAIAMLALPVMAMADAAADLVAALESGNSYVLNENITLNSVVNVTGKVTLSGNGTITTSTPDLFTVSGSGNQLTIKGVTVNSNVSAILYADYSGKIIIDGANLNATAGTYAVAAIWNDSTFEMKSGSMTGKVGDRVTLSVEGGSTATITDGLISSAGSSAVGVLGKSTLNINGGTIENKSSNSSHAAVYGLYSSTINMTKGQVKSDKGQGIYSNEGSTAKISGGNITAAEAVAANAAKGASAVVTGGSFSDDSAAKYIAPGLALVKQGNVWIVEENEVLVGGWDAPETGDKENLMLWVALMAMACMGLAATRKMSRE